MKFTSTSFVIIAIIMVLCTSQLCSAIETRIISLVPSQTELLFALGFGSNIVGVSDYCNYPDETAKIQKIGNMELSIEKIMSLKPTILIDVNHMHRKYELLFSQLGLNYVNFSLKQLDQLPKVASEISQILGANVQASQFIENWNTKTSEVELIRPDKEVKVYLEIWDTPMQGAGGASYIGEMINKAGGTNVLDPKVDFPVVNHETIIGSNPDVILVAYPINSLDSLKNRPGWQNLKAIKNNRIYSLDQDLFVRPGPRNLDGLKILNKIFRQIL